MDTHPSDPDHETAAILAGAAGSAVRAAWLFLVTGWKDERVGEADGAENLATIGRFAEPYSRGECEVALERLRSLNLPEPNQENEEWARTSGHRS
jgi:hypothetical protein